MLLLLSEKIKMSTAHIEILHNLVDLLSSYLLIVIYGKNICGCLAPFMMGTVAETLANTGNNDKLWVVSPPL